MNAHPSSSQSSETIFLTSRASSNLMGCCVICVEWACAILRVCKRFNWKLDRHIYSSSSWRLVRIRTVELGDTTDHGEEMCINKTRSVIFHIFFMIHRNNTMESLQFFPIYSHTFYSTRIRFNQWHRRCIFCYSFARLYSHNIFIILL